MKSHVLESVSLVEELHGHDIYIAFSTASSKSLNNIMESRNIEILQYRSSYPKYHIATPEYSKSLAEIGVSQNPEKTEYELIVNKLSLYLYTDCSDMMADSDFVSKVSNLNFDLVVVDAFPLVQCLYILPHKLRIPFVSITTPYNPWVMRLPALPSFVPSSLSRFTDQMSFTERLNNFVFQIKQNMYAQDDQSLLRKYFPGQRSLSWMDIVRKTQIFFVNQDPILSYPIPITPNVVLVGGLTSHPAKPLPNDLETFANSSKNGLILVSFGSLARHLPDEISVKMADAFKLLPGHNFIWRYSGKMATSLPNNIKQVKWLPQNDILGHERTVLFITHSGNNGQYETLYHGVPMLAFHIFGDQHFNAKRVEKKGFGLEIDLRTFTTNELVQKVNHLISNHTYRATIKKASQIYRDSQQNPRQKAAYWIDHVMKHGGSHLSHTGLEMPWYAYLMLDIIGAFVLGLVSCLTVLALGTILLWKMFNCLKK